MLRSACTVGALPIDAPGPKCSCPPRWKPRAAPAASGAASLPNVLTYLRIVAVPAVVLCLFLIEGDAGRWWALAVYVVACITDWLDGYLARVWRQQSVLGRMLDPIADKLLVGTTLLMLTYDNTIDGAHMAAAVIILCREILVSGLREFLAELNVRVHVTPARQVEDDHADDRARRAAGRARPATRSCPALPRGARHAVGGGAADAVDGLRLPEGRRRARRWSNRAPGTPCP